MLCGVQIMKFTEDYVLRVAFIANSYDFEGEDYLDSKNVHYLVSLYSGSFNVVFINKYIKELQVGTHTLFSYHIGQLISAVSCDNSSANKVVLN